MVTQQLRKYFERKLSFPNPTPLHVSIWFSSYGSRKKKKKKRRKKNVVIFSFKFELVECFFAHLVSSKKHSEILVTDLERDCSVDQALISYQKFSGTIHRMSAQRLFTPGKKNSVDCFIYLFCNWNTVDAG